MMTKYPSKLIKLVDFIFLSRPTLILPGWGFFILGYLHSKGLMNNMGPAMLLPKDIKFWMALVSATLISAYIYVLNQIFDRESDRYNKKLFLIAEGHISVFEASVFAGILLMVSFITGLFVGFKYMVLLIPGFIIGSMYSVPPFRFKGRPLLDMVSNATGYAVLNLGAGYVVGGGSLWDLAKVSSPYFFAVCALYLNTTIPDIPGDRRGGLITTGVYLGEFITSTLGTVFVALSLVSSIITKSVFMFLVSSLSLPFYAWASIKKGDEFHSKTSYRVSGVVFTLLLIIKYPPFTLPAIITLVSLRLYYHVRFGLNYPSLTGK